MAIVDIPHWQRQVFHDNVTGRHHDELAIASVSSSETLERTIVDVYWNVSSGDSDVLNAWLINGILAVAQFTTGTVPPTPDDIGDVDLDDLDVLASAMTRIGPVETFTNMHHAPAYGDALRLDTPVRRRPEEGEAGIVWFTWGLADFTGAGVEVGFCKVFSRVLTIEHREI